MQILLVSIFYFIYFLYKFLLIEKKLDILREYEVIHQSSLGTPSKPIEIVSKSRASLRSSKGKQVYEELDFSFLGKREPRRSITYHSKTQKLNSGQERLLLILEDIFDDLDEVVGDSEQKITKLDLDRNLGKLYEKVEEYSLEEI